VRVASKLAALSAGAALAVALPAAGAAAKPPAGKTYTITLRDMGYGAAPATMHVGDAILWVNADIFVHTATAKDGSFDVELKPKAQAKTVFRKPGQIAFFCRYHPGMTGRLTIVR